ncbi:AAA family ATPase [Clostridium thailandense]|uniref:AAA family ATPase n=1 Tax=Clostridium thailandense TaxID=2794346 RepID=UPI0039895EF1
MKINKLQIGSFGKFKDYELELKDGFQIVYGKNEDGKSTLMAFIKMMFYSKLSAGRDIDKNLRKKYKPWDGSSMNGAVEFEHGGIAYRLQKDIGATPSGDKIALIKMSAGETIALGKNEEVGKRFFGLDLAGFERSVFISQLGSFSANGNNDEVAEKLMSNLVLSGDETVSQQEVINRLNKAIEDMESKSGKKGILVDAKNKLDDLCSERAEIQVLEEEQQDNVKSYHQLQQKLNEQKNMEKLLNLNIDKNKFEQLTSLVEKITKNIGREKKLEKGNIHYNNLKEFLNDCSSLMAESEKTKGSMERLTGSIDTQRSNEDNITSISEEEYKQLSNLVEKESTIMELIKRIDVSFIPALTFLSEAKSSFHDAEAEFKKEQELIGELQKFHEAYEKYKIEIRDRIDEKEALIAKHDKEETKWNTDSKLREQNINFISEKISMQSHVKDSESKKNTNKNPLLLSIAIAIISIILMFVNPVFIIGVIFAAVMGVLTLKSKKQSDTKEKPTNYDAISELEHQLEKLKEENTQEQELIIKKTKQYDGELLEISNTILELEKKLEAVIDKNSAYQTSINNFTELKSNKEMAENLLKIRQDTYNKEINYLLDKYSEDSSLEGDVKITVLQSGDVEELAAREYRNRVNKLCNDLSLKIEEKMKEKSCFSVEEYEDKYFRYASDSKNRKVISEAEQEYKKKAEEFLQKANEYEIVQGYEEAKLLIQKLQEHVTELEREKEEALNIAKGMGYIKPSLDYLRSEVSKLEPSIKQLEEVVATGYSVEELQERLRNFTSENIEEQILELQKKIKTPCKNLSQVQEEIDEIEKEVEEKQNYFDCLKIAAEVMEEASDEMRQSFGPELNKKTSGIFKSLTNGKYGNILVTKDYDISIQSGIHYREWKYLSNGTVDQAYLSLRLAIAELISDRNVILPLFLDDVMIQYDDERMDAALKFISDYAKEKGQEFQMLLFTCHQNIIDNSKMYNTEVVNI